VLESAEALVAEHAALERQMADPALASDPDRMRELNKRYAALGPTVADHQQWVAAVADVGAARELAQEDAGFAQELPDLEATAAEAAGRLRRLLIPRDPEDDRDVILEVKAGEGGEESALFAGDLLRMYLRYAERRGWVAEVLDAQDSDLGGVKDASVAIKTKGVPDGGSGVWSRLKWEGGVHRVQRVPVTESQGRIHTSAAGVLVMPEVEEADVDIDPGDLRIDVYRSQGAGGQSVNTTDSAVRITHVPTGIVVTCQNERSQLQNKDRALRMLRAKLAQLAEEQAAAAAADVRKAQVRTVDRSERIRTYNFPQNRISDHRVGYTAYNLDLAIGGDLDAVLDALTDADRAARLAGETELSRQ